MKKQWNNSAIKMSYQKYEMFKKLTNRDREQFYSLKMLVGICREIVQYYVERQN